MSIFISPIHTQLFCKAPEVSKVFSSDRKMFILDLGERYKSRREIVVIIFIWGKTGELPTGFNTAFLQYKFANVGGDRKQVRVVF